MNDSNSVARMIYLVNGAMSTSYRIYLYVLYVLIDMYLYEV